MPRRRCDSASPASLKVSKGNPGHFMDRTMMVGYPAVVLARMTSERLPGKVLRDIAGQPLIRYVIDALRHCPAVTAIAIATSEEPSDEPLVHFARSEGVEVIRGDLRNAASRFLKAIRSFDDRAVFRVNGDSPLINGELFVRAAEVFSAGEYDIITNIQPRTCPPGMSVELVRTDAFVRACELMSQPEDQEHVTRFLYQHPEQFRIGNLTHSVDYSNIHLAVDTPEDLAAVEHLIAALDGPPWSQSVDDIIACYRRIDR